MSENKKAYLRIQQRNDSTAAWNTANTAGFKPLQGEIIVYNDVNRIKIGDGSDKTISNIPFLDDNCVHKTGNETITGTKTFENDIDVKETARFSGGVLSSTIDSNRVLDCYADGEEYNDTIFGVDIDYLDDVNGQSKGHLILGDGNTSCSIMLGSSYGTSGQVLTSQGSGKTPIWSTVTAAAPSNMVTTNTEQTISANKTITSTLTFNGTNPIKIVDPANNNVLSIETDPASTSGSATWYPVRVTIGNSNTGSTTYHGVTLTGASLDVGHNLWVSGSTYLRSLVHIDNANEGIYFHPDDSSKQPTQLFLGDDESSDIDYYAPLALPAFDARNMRSGQSYYKLMVADGVNEINTTTSGSATYRGEGGINLNDASRWNVCAVPNGTDECTFNVQTKKSSTTTTIFSAGAYGSYDKAIVRINAPLSLGNTYTNTGSGGQVLTSHAGSGAPTWETTSTSKTISVQYVMSSNGGNSATSATYPGFSTTPTASCAVAIIPESPGSSVGTVIFHGHTTTNVTADRWIKLNFAKVLGSSTTDGYILGATAVGRKSTTAGTGPKVITYISGKYVYIGADENAAPAGVDFVVSYRGDLTEVSKA